MDDPLVAEGHRRALEVVRACASEDGFLASTVDEANYRRVWGRDGSVMTLAALLGDDEELITAGLRTLRTLARYQGPHGEIPSNVDPHTERVSYGGTAGRVDAGLWWTIAVVEAWRRGLAGDGFMDEMEGPLERYRALLGAWEYNGRGLLFVPPTGDWADEYVQSGYVLYDQVLYLQAQRGLAEVRRARVDAADHLLDERVARLTHLIRANYWFDDDRDEPPDDVYHRLLWRKGREAAGHCAGRHWMPFFSPLGYGTRFDAMAHALVSLFGVSDDAQDAQVDAHLEDGRVVELDEDAWALPAFDPVITPRDEYWDDLQMSFSHTFKNEPYHYHNGGVWPLVAGLYAAAKAARGDRERAERYRRGVHAAHRAERDGEAWSFSEYLDGRDLEPAGTAPLGWNAAAALIADAYLDGERWFA